MVELSLQCVIVGATGSAFAIDIDDNRRVAHLKEKIKQANRATIPCDAKDLQLFLAKTDRGGWLDEAMVLDDLQHFAPMDSNLLVKNPKHFGPNFKPVQGQVHILVVVSPPDEKTSPSLAAMERALFQHTFLYVHITRPPKTEKMKKQLVKEYECDRGNNKNGDSMLLCMVMNIGLPSSVVTASHISVKSMTASKITSCKLRILTT
ncbi:hypothetical protein DVH05_024740 [Phytophthora capsici]|nr:hypothetical protein DVH05_024740 [Phytophthora capsici]